MHIKKKKGYMNSRHNSETIAQNLFLSRYPVRSLSTKKSQFPLRFTEKLLEASRVFFLLFPCHFFLFGRAANTT